MKLDVASCYARFNSRVTGILLDENCFPNEDDTLFRFGKDIRRILSHHLRLKV